MTRGELDASRTRRASGGQGRAVAVAAGPAGAGRPGPRHACRGAVPIRAGGAVASLVQRLKRHLKWLCLGTEGTRGRRAGAGPPRGHCATADPEGPRAPPASLLRASPVPSAACGRDPLGNAAFTGLSSEGAARPPRPPHCAGPSWPPETAPRVTKIPAVTSSAVSSGGRCAARPWQELSPGWVRVLTVSRGPQGHEDKGLGTCKCLCNEVTFNHLPLSCIPQNRSMEIRTRPPPKQSAETTYNT